MNQTPRTMTAAKGEEIIKKARSLGMVFPREFVDPRKSSGICKGCKVLRSCVTKTGLPNCSKQFFDD